ncbi:uncharacterized protein LOC18425215 [Amborella trichopoda]|uniref:uncharacterized protein LOC18425215 n=1 Tax=Amborella trichopoda TaxID=13333 RepID=UPI0009BE7FE6|nr:uncharacterized protein LOC18425215 [Amborella trichopoda]|eukprot:XP_006829844.3 uncharacterized protein LOC18425215 [Amborella trichopoda]
MGSRGRPLFDLNEPPGEEEEVYETLPDLLVQVGNQGIVDIHGGSHTSSVSDSQTVAKDNPKGCTAKNDKENNQGESLIPSSSKSSAQVLPVQCDSKNQNLSHLISPSFSLFSREDEINATPFVAPKHCRRLRSRVASTSHKQNTKCPKKETSEREEGEYPVMWDVANALGSSHGTKFMAIPKQKVENPFSKGHGGLEDISIDSNSEVKSEKKIISALRDGNESAHMGGGFTSGISDDKCQSLSRSDSTLFDVVNSISGNHEESSKGDAHIGNSLEEPAGSTATVPKDSKVLPKDRPVMKCPPIGKKHTLDQKKEAMLGKKRARQTMFLNLEDVKQASAVKTSTPKRVNSLTSPLTSRAGKETLRGSRAPVERMGDRQGQPITKDQKQADLLSNERYTASEVNDKQKTDWSGDENFGDQASNDESSGKGQIAMFPKRLSNNSETPLDPIPPHVSRQSSWKHIMESRQSSQPFNWDQGRDVRDSRVTNKKHLPSKKNQSSSTSYQDTSVERLHREVTNDKFWHHPEVAELQSVPGRFESVEEYVRVFEPLLFEECRAQLYSTWEELSETGPRDAHTMVRVKNVERRERGWYDVIVLPLHECKWTFKEGDVAVLSSSKPETVRLRRTKVNSGTNEDEVESEAAGRVAGTVRRFSPVDTREPPGAILHFYVGDKYDANSKMDEDPSLLKNLQQRGTWYLTVLGTLATTQREYLALHAFRRLNHQMQNAILQPSPEHFPKYEEQPPAMPECFTQNFVDHLHRTFNGPQLAAIQWAAMHTAAGTSSLGSSKRQDPWPFTLVQGPPGTGKTHTVWGMLNVIHLVHYQHYYAALLKKLAPESYKQPTETSSESVCSGSIDEVLQSMDKNLLRTLPKLCPKPRMLVCAPSNAATDELLSRVLDRGFIDGEMKVYRPDVARVGVDTQTRAAQAVSVERRTEQLLTKSREEIISWMHQLKLREAQFSQQIAALQRELNVAAAAVRSQGSMGVDPEVLMARDHNRDSLLQNLAAVVEGRDKVLVEMSRLVILESQFRAGGGFNTDEARASLEASFANEAEIVFTTLSSSGRKLFSRLTHGFDMVVIDEAAQASEVGVLPPLALGAARCVLVGDPQQLPATVISQAAGTLLYSRSLFERFQQAGCPTILLSVQYRMHPQIREFPSRYFYQGRLTDSESVLNLPDEVYYRDPLLRPYNFYDIMHGRESHRGGSASYQNVHEAQFALKLYEHLQKIVKASGGGKVTVGIITPYKLQLKCLQREFQEVLASEEGKGLYINTVDAFQGQERDVIIMSCVRASNHGVGFVADIRRMNVALTRARRALWVMGNAAALIQSEDWAALIADAKGRGCFVDMESIPKEFTISKPPIYNPMPNNRFPVNSRMPRMMVGPKHRHPGMFAEPKSLSLPNGEEKPDSSVPSNGTYRAAV